jgi:hypothetical protein
VKRGKGLFKFQNNGKLNVAKINQTNKRGRNSAAGPYPFITNLWPWSRTSTREEASI